MPSAIPRLADLTWPEASVALQDAVLLLPIGAIEAHGPHLPLDTDVRISLAVADRAAASLLASKRRPLVLPAVAYGVSYVGACFPGTTPCPPDALTRQITEALSTCLDNGAAAAIIVNSHLEPAHVQAIAAAADLVRGMTGKPVAFPDHRVPPYSLRLSAEFQAGMRHAGDYETSILLAACPEVVRAEFLPGLPPVNIDLPARLKAGARTFADAGGDMGYFGNPAAATAAEGERMLAALAAIMLDELAAQEALS